MHDLFPNGDSPVNRKLFFLQLPNPEMAIARVRQRVRGGGHNVPETVVHRRFHAGLKNFYNVYKPLVSWWSVFDNSGPEPILLAEGQIHE